MFFAKKTFADCSLLPRQRMPHPKFWKTFAYSHKTAKFVKVFRYTVRVALYDVSKAPIVVNG